MRLFILSSRGYSTHDGMDQDTVFRLLTELGATDIKVISEADFYTGIKGA